MVIGVIAISIAIIVWQILDHLKYQKLMNAYVNETMRIKKYFNDYNQMCRRIADEDSTTNENSHE